MNNEFSFFTETERQLGDGVLTALCDHGNIYKGFQIKRFQSTISRAASALSAHRRVWLRQKPHATRTGIKPSGNQVELRGLFYSPKKTVFSLKTLRLIPTSHIVDPRSALPRIVREVAPRGNRRRFIYSSRCARVFNPHHKKNDVPGGMKKSNQLFLIPP